MKWPGWRHVGYAALLSALVNVLFAIVYFGADYVTGRRAHHVNLFFREELAIPLWPWTIVVYDSLYLLFLLVPFLLTTRERLRHLALAAAGTIAVSGALFLLIPAQLGFAHPVVTGTFRTLFEASDRLNLDYNLVPSLHVGLAVICGLAFWPELSMIARVALAAWCVALILSTLFTHQHHVIDAAAGVAVAWVMFRAAALAAGRRELRAR